MVIAVAQLRSCFAAVRTRCKSPKQSPSPLAQQPVPHSPDHHRLRTFPGVLGHLELLELLELSGMNRRPPLMTGQGIDRCL